MPEPDSALAHPEAEAYEAFAAERQRIEQSPVDTQVRLGYDGAAKPETGG